MRIYLDACGLNRPFDDQSQTRVHLESEAVLAIIQRVEDGHWSLLSSRAPEFELMQMPDQQRRVRTLKLSALAMGYADVGPTERTRATALQQAHRLRALDALHLACADTLHADAFLTTDDRLVRAIRRSPVKHLAFEVANPLAWLIEQLTSG